MKMSPIDRAKTGVRYSLMVDAPDKDFALNVLAEALDRIELTNVIIKHRVRQGGICGECGFLARPSYHQADKIIEFLLW